MMHDDDDGSGNGDVRNERAGFIRIPKPLQARWLERCHRENINANETAAIKLEQALRQEGSLLHDAAERTGDEEE